jgi:pyruvate dehydrogenase E2 component (dihydrolipoamide acetyltransferase)
VAAGPATRRLARELGLELSRVEGSGAGGRVTADDVKAASRARRITPEPEKEPAALPDFERFGPVERRPFTALDRAAVRRLSASWRAIPHVTQHDVADVTELEAMRRRFEEKRRPSDPKLTPTTLVVKAVVAALRAFPRVNASLDLEREERVLKRYCHVGVAVDTEHGLLVPVVRDADRKTTRQIAAEIAGLAQRARERKLTREEMQGASFTVTNLGGIGGTAFTPIVSHPEVAILGVSRLREEPVVREGDVVVRLLLPLSLSYDHRALDGADAARFVRYVAGLLEDPLRLLMES